MTMMKKLTAVVIAVAAVAFAATTFANHHKNHGHVKCTMTDGKTAMMAEKACTDKGGKVEKSESTTTTTTTTTTAPADAAKASTDTTGTAK